MIPEDKLKEVEEKYRPMFHDPLELIKLENFTEPHPFTIGPRHVAYASDHCSGRLGKEAIEASGVGCQMRGCGQPLSAHVTKTACFIRVLRACTNKEAYNVLHAIKERAAAESDQIDGFAFPEGFKLIAKPLADAVGEG